MDDQAQLTALAEEFKIGPLVARRAWLEALNQLIPHLYEDTGAAPEASHRAMLLRDLLLEALRAGMLESLEPPRTRMKFGTSGWRGLLHEDFTAHNVACVTQGLVDTLLSPALHPVLGVESNDDLRARGCVIAHDTRIAGPELAAMAARVLLAHGIKVIDLGMATTPEVSAAVHELHAAFSINFTPSHNPFTYHGFKFNPADGGPAPATLTGPVAVRANEILDGGLGYTALTPDEWERARQDPDRYLEADPIELYTISLEKRLPWLNLPELIRKINATDLEIFIDNGFGATRGKYEQLLAGVDPARLHVFNGGQDFLFGGKSREPSAENFRQLQLEMRKSSARLVVGFMNDGDGDRFVGGGREAVLVMNKYGPLVVRYLSQALGLHGDVTRSVMTSHMADAARARYLPQGILHETKVGFQYMRPFIPISVNSWEESDGMSPRGWSLDKDGLVAALLLTAMILHYQAPAEALLEQLEHELGHYYFERGKVTGRLVGDPLSAALADRFGHIQPGDALRIDGRAFKVARCFSLDGTKVVLENGWWFGVRASGTEPVVRPYVETFTGPGASEAERLEAKDWQDRIMGWLRDEILRTVG